MTWSAADELRCVARRLDGGRWPFLQPQASNLQPLSGCPRWGRAFVPVLVAAVLATGAVLAADDREPFQADAVALEAAVSGLRSAAQASVRPSNDNRRRILLELDDLVVRAQALAKAAASDDTKAESFRALARANDLTGYLAADLPRSRPFASVAPALEQVRTALARVNRSGAVYFGAAAPGPQTEGLTDELATRATALTEQVRARMGHSSRRHGLVVASQEFAAHARAFAASLRDPLVTEGGRRARLSRLACRAVEVDRALLASEAPEAIRALWAGVRDTLALLESRF